MNEATKQFFVKLHLKDELSGASYVDWAMDCLEEGFDTKSLRLLAGMNKTHSIEADFDELFRQSLEELGWKYPGKKEALFNYAKDMAKQVLSNEIDAVEAVEKISEIYVRLGCPAELEIWNLLNEGHSDEWFDSSRWIPGLSKFNRENWLAVVKREAQNLTEQNFL